MPDSGTVMAVPTEPSEQDVLWQSCVYMNHIKFTSPGEELHCSRAGQRQGFLGIPCGPCPQPFHLLLFSFLDWAKGASTLHLGHDSRVFCTGMKRTEACEYAGPSSLSA